jgi:hypothetical protein
VEIGIETNLLRVGSNIEEVYHYEEVGLNTLILHHQREFVFERINIVLHFVQRKKDQSQFLEFVQYYFSPNKCLYKC